MTTRTVETEHDRTMLCRFVESHKLPFIAEITPGKPRSVEQNKLQRKWMTEISEQMGDRTPEEVRAYCKLTIGVPLLREESELFREKYDAIVRPLPYEQKIAIMSEPLDMPVTRLMTTRQKHAYLDAIFQHFSEKGIVLTIPPDKRYGPAIEQEPSAEIPPADAGSAVAAPDGTPDPSAQAAELEAGGHEAEDVPAAAPASGDVDERAMVNSAKPMAYDGLKAEMVKKVLAMAGDQTLSVQERLESLDNIRPAWDDQIKGHPGLVRQVFDTAAKVIRGELPAAKAKQYLETL
jgi:hypothetical protein